MSTFGSSPPTSASSTVCERQSAVDSSSFTDSSTLCGVDNLRSDHGDVEPNDEKTPSPTDYIQWEKYLLHTRLHKNGEPIMNPNYNLEDVKPPFQPPPSPQPQGWLDRLHQSASKNKIRRIFEKHSRAVEQYHRDVEQHRAEMNALQLRVRRNFLMRAPKFDVDLAELSAYSDGYEIKGTGHRSLRKGNHPLYIQVDHQGVIRSILVGGFINCDVADDLRKLCAAVPRTHKTPLYGDDFFHDAGIRA